MNLAPYPIQKFFDNAGRPLNGGLLFTYVAGTTTKLATYTDSSGGTPNTNPIVLNFRGEANVWLDPTLTYKFVLSPANDTDPPTNPIWTVDHIAGALTISDITQGFLGPIIYPRTQAEIDASVTPTFYIYPPLDVRRYGGVFDGITNDSAAWQAAFNVCSLANGAGPGGEIFAPALPTLWHTQVTCNISQNRQMSVRGYGCRIITDAAITPLAVTGQAANGCVTLYGLRFDNNLNATATGAVDVFKAWHVRFVDCQWMGGTAAGSYCVRLRNGTANDDSTGCFFTRFLNCSFYSTGNNTPIGIRAQGSANDTKIIGCEFGGPLVPIQFGTEGASPLDTTPNACSIIACAFETYNIAIESQNNASPAPCQTGLTIMSCRFENGATAVLQYGVTLGAVPAVPPQLMGNYLVSNAGTYLVTNANARPFSSFDCSSTPQLNRGLHLETANPLFIAPTNTSVNCLDLQAASTTLGMILRDNTAAQIGSWVFRPGGGSKLTTSGLHVTAATPTAAAGEVAFGTSTSTTVGAAGGASAPPATPVKYLTVNEGGNNYKLALYNP